MSCNGFIRAHEGTRTPRPESLDPKSNAATNYATCAGDVNYLCKDTAILRILQT